MTPRFLPLCAALPSGTHFLWHLLNAVVLYGLTGTMMRYAVEGPDAGR